MTGRGVSGGWRQPDRRAVAVDAILVSGVAIAAGLPTAVGVAAGTGSTAVALAWVLPPAVLLVVATAIGAVLHHRRTRYRVGPERVELHTGVLVRSRRSVQRDRIRTVDLTADPLLRLFGLVKVRVGTGERAGSGGLVLSPLTRSTGDELRRVLLDRAGVDTDDSHADGQLAAFDRRWLRYAPLSFVAPAVGAGLYGGVLNVADWFGLQSDVIDWVIGRLAEVPVVGAIAVLTAGALVIGTVGALLLSAEMWWGHRLDREPGGTLRVRRGLLTTRSISIEESRLRGVDVVEPLGVRLVGAARVDAVATGLAAGSGAASWLAPEATATGLAGGSGDGGAGSGTLLPTAPRAIAHRVAGQVLGEPVSPTTAALVAHPRAARSRRLRAAVAVVIIGVLPLLVLGVLLTEVLLHLAWILAVLALPVAVLLALDAYRSLGHALVGDHLVVRSGSVRRSTVALRRRGIIGWTVRQSVLQRRAGLATVRACAAAGTGDYAVRDVGIGVGLDLADDAVPGLLTPFLERPPVAADPGEPAPDREPAAVAAPAR